ncbi:MAG: HEPN domain-containing protein [Elainellaceae cyanobacterium]
MSEEKRRQNARRWYQQAMDDLDAARALLMANKYPQACFYAQQAGEKAMKAVWMAHDLDPWGCSIGKLIRDLPESLSHDFMPLLDTGLGLDKLYIPTRYPDALADLTPAEAYTQTEAQSAIASSQTLLSHISHYLEQQA